MQFTRFDLVGMLTLLFFLVYGDGYAEYPAEALAIVGLLFPAARRHWSLWAAMAAIHLVLEVVPDWSEMVNHEWLAIWWVVALAGAARSPEPDEALAPIARLLVGLVFAFAVIWKVTTPEFTSGAFFEFTLVTDPRFEVVGELAGGLPDGARERNRSAIADGFGRGDDPAGSDQVALIGGPRIAVVADVLVVSTIVVEGLVALAFLLPATRAGPWGALTRRRDAALIGFVVFTYPLAPVVSFAWLLLAMGLAQAERHDPRARLWWVGAFVMLHPIDQGSFVWQAIDRVT